MWSVDHSKGKSAKFETCQFLRSGSEIWILDLVNIMMVQIKNLTCPVVSGPFQGKIRKVRIRLNFEIWILDLVNVLVARIKNVTCPVVGVPWQVRSCKVRIVLNFKFFYHYLGWIHSICVRLSVSAKVLNSCENPTFCMM
jgi:hypothetical protein